MLPKIKVKCPITHGGQGVREYFDHHFERIFLVRIQEEIALVGTRRNACRNGDADPNRLNRTGIQRQCWHNVQHFGHQKRVALLDDVFAAT